MLTVACVRCGRKYGPRYVNILQAAVKRNLTREHRFVCLTDDPKGLNCDTIKLPGGLEGWWNKLVLFKPGVLSGTVLYLDLDVCITGALDQLFDCTPFFIIADWHLDCYNSSVMCFNPRDYGYIWDDYDGTIYPGGDQEYITKKVPMAGIFPAGWCVSYRTHAVPGVPKGARIVVMHGLPKPHELMHTWVSNYWRLDKCPPSIAQGSSMVKVAYTQQ